MLSAPLDVFSALKYTLVTALSALKFTALKFTIGGRSKEVNTERT